MRQICKFDDKLDFQRTRPSLFTSISVAIESGVVMDTGIDVTVNDIENPSAIWGRIQDVFTAIDVQKRLTSVPGSSVSNSRQSNLSQSQPSTGESE